MENLSPHFSLEEMTHTEVRLPNTPEPQELVNLAVTAAGMEQVRDILGGLPIRVNSGYRSPEVNTAVGGSLISDHPHGWCCDFVCPAYGDPYKVAKAIAHSRLHFDQLILEYGWVHISFSPKMRQQMLTKRSASAPYEKGLNQ